MCENVDHTVTKFRIGTKLTRMMSTAIKNEMDYEQFMLLYYTLHFLDCIAFQNMDADCNVTKRLVQIYFANNFFVASFLKQPSYSGLPYLGEIRLTQSVMNTHREIPAETVRFYLDQLKTIGMFK